MNIRAYLYTVNKNRSFALSLDEIKDVEQEAKIQLLNKDYNNRLIRLTVLSYYRQAINSKIKQSEHLATWSQTELDPCTTIEDPEPDITEERTEKIKNLELSPVQKKIVRYLVSGLKYVDIRKKLKLSERQLKNQIYLIKQKNIKK